MRQVALGTARAHVIPQAGATEMAVIRHVPEQQGVVVPLAMADLQLGRRGEDHIHNPRELLLTGFDPGDRHSRLILNAINAVINTACIALWIEIEGGERVVGPEDRIGEAQPTANELEPTLEKTAIEPKSLSAVASGQYRR